MTKEFQKLCGFAFHRMGIPGHSRVQIQNAPAPGIFQTRKYAATITAIMSPWSYQHRICKSGGIEWNRWWSDHFADVEEKTNKACDTCGIAAHHVGFSYAFKLRCGQAAWKFCNMKNTKKCAPPSTSWKKTNLANLANLQNVSSLSWLSPTLCKL